MRKKIAAGNWKMNKTFDEAVSLTKAITESQIPSDVTVILGVPFPYLNKINGIAQSNNRVFVSAQNSHQELSGAYTGETSVLMLNSIDIPYVILGHSERREYNKETPELLKKKVKVALDNNLEVIFCCGESLDIRKSNNQEEFVRDQIKRSLSGLSADEMKKVTIAYEPIWAIGTGETASPQQAQEMHKSIRDYLKELFDEAVAENTPILYGGSVKPANAKDIFGKKDVDGGLVGGASMVAESFIEIINSFS